MIRAVLIIALASTPLAGLAQESGFDYEPIVQDGLSKPTDLTFVGDAGFIVSGACGHIYHVGKSGAATQVGKLSVRCDSEDAGLIGIAVAGDWETDGWLYVYYTRQDLIAQKVARLPLSRDGDKIVVNDAGEKTLYEDLPFNLTQVRNSGAIGIGPDDMLYVGVGDNGKEHNVQDDSKPHGKILKSKLNGSSSEQFAIGLGRPFKLGIDGSTGAVWVGDRGRLSDEEIFVAKGGENFGWPSVDEGDVTAPVYKYSGNLGAPQAVVLGAPYRAPEGAEYAFPEFLEGAVPVADYYSNWVRFLQPKGDAYEVFDTSPGPSSVRAIATGSDGALYFVESTTGKERVSRIIWNDAPPTVTITSPKKGDRYSGGQKLTLEGTAEDEKDGAITAGFEWSLTLYDGEDSVVDTATAKGNPAEYQLPADVDIHGKLEIQLGVKDSVGATGIGKLTVDPEATKVTYGSDPAGVEITVDGAAITEPTTIIYAAGTKVQLKTAVDVQLPDDPELYVFDSWSDGTSEADVEWTVPEGDLDMTAKYRLHGAPPPDSTDTNIVVEKPPAFAEPEAPPPEDDDGGCSTSNAPSSGALPAALGLLMLLAFRRRVRS